MTQYRGNAIHVEQKRLERVSHADKLAYALSDLTRVYDRWYKAQDDQALLQALVRIAGEVIVAGRKDWRYTVRTDA